MKTKILRFLLAPALCLAAFSQAVAQPLITLQPQNILNLILGNTATFQVAATSTATPNLQYQWLKNGVRIPGATNSGLTINGTQATDSGAFTCRVNDGVGVVESSTASLTVNILTLLGDTLLNTLSLTNGQIRSSNIGDIKAPGEPDIVPGDPGGSAVWYSWTPLLSGVATFTTLGSDFDTILGVYTGSAPDNLVAVPSAINNDDGGGYLCSRLTFNASALTTYLINVDGYYGAQGNIVLTWGLALGDSLPAASATPATATAPSTNAVQLSSPWAGKKCDWLFNNAVVATNTNSLTVTNLNDSTVGSYVARFTTANGSVAYARPTSLQQTTIQDGTSATNSFAWNKFLDSATAVYAPSGSPQKMDGGDTRGYSVAQVYNTQGNSDEPGEPIVCNQDGGSPSWYTYVTPASGSMVISTAGSSFNTILGVFTGSANSFSTLTNVGCGYTTNYVLEGQPVVEIANVPAHQTNYIMVEGEGGVSGTVHLNISLGAPVSINAAPSNQAAGPGTNLTLAVSASGASPLSYTWQFNGACIPGATNGSLVISNVEPSQAGVYTVVVSNRVSVTSAQAMVSFVQPPSIVNQPSNQVVCFGSSATFNYAVTGDAPLTYQWQHGGANCAAATNSWLTVANAQMSDAGSYSCLASNLAGIAISSAATLTIAQVAPSVMWPSPGAIIYGTALSSSQLAATASVPGTFAYTPAIGSVLNVGTQNLSVVFIPTDAVDYTSVTNSTSIVVSPAPLTVSAKNRTKTYGQAVAFAGTEFTVAGLLNGDAVTGVTLTSSGAPATAGLAGSPYSIAPSSAVGTGLGNYAISYANAALTVSAASLTVTAGSRTKTYGQTVAFAGIEFTAMGLVNGDVVSGVTLASSGATASAGVAGSPYSIMPSGAVGSGLGNYAITYANGVLTVNAASLTVTASSRSKTYGQTVAFAGTEFSAAGLVNGDVVSEVTLASSGATASAGVAGSPYSIMSSGAVGSGLGNYAITYANGVLTVNTASLTVTASSRSKAYGQTVAFAGTEFSAAGLVNGDVVSEVTLASPGATATASVAGSPYSIVPSGAVGSSLGNYAITYANGFLTVNAASLTVTASSRSKAYGQTVAFAGTEFSAAGLVNGDVVSEVTLASPGATATASVAGSPYSIVPSGAVGSGLGNYAITYANGFLTVNAASLTVTASSRSKTYGQTVVFAGSEFTVTGLVNGDVVSGVTLASSGATASAGVAGSPYKIVSSAAIGSGLRNYAVTYANGVLTVNAGSLMVTANNKSKTYGHALTFVGTEFSTAGLVNGDMVTGVTLTSVGATATATVAGSPYAIISSAATGTGLNNYAITYASGTLMVSTAFLTVTANNRTKTYGQTIAFGGSEFTAAGLLNNDTLSGVVLTSSGAVAAATVAGSPYVITAGSAVGAGLNNYIINYASGTLAINPASLTVTANNLTKTYGQTLAFTGSEFTAAGLLNADTIASATLSSAGGAATATAANYSIAPSAPVGTGLGNYLINYANGTLAVTPAALTVRANNLTKTYGQTIKFTGTEFTASGVLNADTINSVTLVSAGASAPATVAGSPYFVVPSAAAGTGLSNYAISYVNGVLTVGDSTVIVTWPNPAPLVYGTPLTDVQLSATANVAGTFSYIPTNGTVLNSGTNTLSVVFFPTDSTDYESVTNTISLGVTPAPLTITSANASRVYGQANPGLTGTITGVTNGDNITATFSTTAGVNSPLGSYAIVPTLADPNNRETNYSVSLVNGLLTINQATPSVAWTNPAAITYGTALTSNQLNAIASVSGTFAYNPVIGTVLDTGTNGLFVVFTPADSVDYSSVTGTVMVAILPASLTVSATSVSRPFNAANPSFSGAINGLTNGDNISASYSCGASIGSSVGTYPIVPSLTDPDNRQTNYVVNLVDGILVVGHPTQAFTWTNPAPIIYGTPLSVIQLAAAANIPGSYAYTPTNGTVLNSGTNALSVIFTPADPVDYIGMTDVVSMVVLPAQLTVTASVISRLYGQPNPELACVLTGVTNGDNITNGCSCAATPASPVGSYSAVPSAVAGNDLTNYTITYVNGSLAINPALLTITANNASKTYGQTLTFSGTEFSAEGLLNGDTVTSAALACSGAPPTAVATGGPYNIVPSAATGSGLSNYTVAYGTGLLTINPAQLTITAKNFSKTYGESVFFAGTEFTASGLINGDRVDSIALASSGELAIASVAGSPYFIVPGAAVGSGLGNYNISYVSGSLAVNSAALTITANNLGKTFGQVLAFSGTEFAVSGLVNGDTVNTVVLTSAGTAAAATVAGSPFNIIPSAALGAGLANYSITYADGNLIVNGAVPNVTWSNPASITYGTVLNAIQLDASASVDGSFAYTPTNGTVLSAGSNILSLVFTPTDNGDYTSVTNSVSLVVAPAPLTITAANASRAYGQNNPWLASTLTGLTNGDNITVACNCGATNSSTVGTYLVVPSLVDPANRQTNYTVSFVNGTLTVTQAVPVVDWTNPAPIMFGASLTPGQLDATANVPGSFAYTPPIGSILTAGDNTLSSVFTPDDAVDYSNVTNVVSLIVVASVPQPPQLQTSVQGGAFVLTWPTNAASAALEMTTDIRGGWTPLSGSMVVGDQYVLTTSMTGTSAFFRLKQ